MSGTLEADPPAGAGGYSPGPGWDEAFEAPGQPRRLYADLIAALAEVDLARLAEELDRDLRARGVTFGAGDAIFQMDPVPRLIDSGEWSHTARGLEQRVRALAAFVADVYSEQAIVKAGRVPSRVLESADHFEPGMVGLPVHPAGFVAGLDLVRGGDGVLRVLEDNTRTPSGTAYVIAARQAVDAQVPLSPPEDRLEPNGAFDLLGAALRASAPEGVHEPHIVLLSDGPANSAWYEHREIARHLGLALVAPEDLVMRSGRLHYMLEGSRTRQVDVLYRRTDEDRLRDTAGRPTWLADRLLEAIQGGTLSVVNPFGAGVADDKLAHAYVEEMVRFYLGEDPLLTSVRTYDLGDPETREAVLPRLDDLVVKPRGGYGGKGIVVCRHATEEDRRIVRRRVLAHPEEWIAQETVDISTHPTVCSGRLEPRHVDLRPFVIGGGAEAEVVPGGLTRVAFGEGALVVNSSQSGGGKDTWVLG
jgi:uncharacterized circularly permuted ATP-grasp superfamily protein